ncbi:MAG: helix-turn-helix domain-containing protein [Actinobacteria bacterium]|nr:helix-turn-helix domain-containing protein [Actinomycetota bacterium]
MTTRISLNTKQAAEATGVSQKTIENAIRRGELIAHYPTSRPLVLLEDLDAWVRSAPTERAS